MASRRHSNIPLSACVFLMIFSNEFSYADLTIDVASPNAYKFADPETNAIEKF
jgi:hypothetical protein